MHLFKGDFSEPGLYYVNVEWCGHCRRARPMVEELSNELGGALAVYDVDGDTWGPAMKQRFGAKAPTSYPTIMHISPDGQIVQFNDERTARNLRDFACDVSGSC